MGTASVVSSTVLRPYIFTPHNTYAALFSYLSDAWNKS